MSQFNKIVANIERRMTLPPAYSRNSIDNLIIELRQNSNRSKSICLTGIDFSKRDLSGINFANACLINANLRDANFSSANLVNAKLTGADLRGY